MLKINPDPTFTVDVEITIPGKRETGTIPLTFKYLTRDELRVFWDDNKGKPDTEVMSQLILGWGLGEEFTQGNLETFFKNYPVAAIEIAGDYQRLLLESRVKN